MKTIFESGKIVSAHHGLFSLFKVKVNGKCRQTLVIYSHNLKYCNADFDFRHGAEKAVDGHVVFHITEPILKATQTEDKRPSKTLWGCMVK